MALNNYSIYLNLRQRSEGEHHCGIKFYIILWIVFRGESIYKTATRRHRADRDKHAEKLRVAAEELVGESAFPEFPD